MKWSTHLRLWIMVCVSFWILALFGIWQLRVDHDREFRTRIMKLMEAPHDYSISREFARQMDVDGNQIAELGWLMFGAVSGDETSMELLVRWSQQHCGSMGDPDRFGKPFEHPWRVENLDVGAQTERERQDIKVNTMSIGEVCCAVIKYQSINGATEILVAQAKANAKLGESSDLAGMGWLLYGSVLGDGLCMSEVARWIDTNGK